MATIFLEEKIVDPTHEKRLSTTSPCEFVLHGVPTSPDKLYQIFQKQPLPSVTIASLDKALPNRKQEDTTLRDPFVTAKLPTPSIGRPSTGTAIKQSNPALETAIDPGLTPPLSIHQTSGSSLTTGRQQSSKTIKPILPDIQSIATIGQCCFISHTQLVPEDYRTHWTATLKSRIDETLLQELPPSNDNQSSLVLVLRMAGTRERDLRPSILVTCCSDSKKRGKAVMKIMSQLRKTGGLRGPQGDNLPYFVRVQGGFQLLMAGAGLENPILEARVENSASTMCGVSARFRYSPGLGANDNVVKFTIGGIILINQRMNYLTTAHPFLPSETLADDVSGSSLSSTIGDVSETNSIEVDNAVELETIKLSHDGINLRPGVTQDLAFRTLEYGGMCLPCTSRFENASIRSSVRASDWAVFSASDGSDGQQAINSIHIPGQHELTFIESTMTKAELREGQVWIAAGSGLHSGILNPVPASILIRNSICEVREICLTSPLVEGDSGSWVVQEGRLCGMIVAGCSSPPWAYMLLVEDIFSEIASCLPEVLSVSLSTRTETGNDCSLSTTLGAERRETVEPLRPPPRQVYFEFPASEDVSGNATSRLHIKTPVSNLDIPIHNPLAQTIRIRNLFSRLSFRLLGRATASGTENVSNVPQQSSQVRRTTRKKVRHYPRSPARARREAALHSRSPPRGT